MKLGSTVTLIYRGTLEDGTLFGKADADEPMVFQTGMDLVIDGLENEILEMEKGEKKTFTVGMYDAYGEHLDDFVERVPLENIPFGDIEVGKRVWMINDAGEKVAVTVAAVEPDAVLFDMNHPLAGHDLTFEVEILDVEDAPENFISAKEKAKLMGQNNQAMGFGGEDGFTMM